MMRFFNKEKNTVNNLSKTEKRVKKGYKLYCCLVLVVTMVFLTALTAFAANDNPLTVINNLSTFIFGLILASVLFKSVFLSNHTTRRRELTAFLPSRAALSSHSLKKFSPLSRAADFKAMGVSCKMGTPK